MELTASYDRGPWSLYGNLAWSRAMGKNIISAQFNFGADELAFIGKNFIHLDHDQTWTARPARLHAEPGQRSPDALFGDAMVQAACGPARRHVPNGIALPTYGVVNLSVVQKLTTGTSCGSMC